MRARGRTDSNQAALVEVLRAGGASVAITSSLGRGFPDVVIGYRGSNYLAEIKAGLRDAWGHVQKLTPAESAWHDAWRGGVLIMRSLDDAEAFLRDPGGYSQSK